MGSVIAGAYKHFKYYVFPDTMLRDVVEEWLVDVEEASPGQTVSTDEIVNRDTKELYSDMQTRVRDLATEGARKLSLEFRKRY